MTKKTTYKNTKSVTGVIEAESDKRRKRKEGIGKTETISRKAFSLSPDAVTITRLDSSTYISVNPAFTKIMGYTEDDCIGKSSLDLGIWKDIQIRQHILDKLKKEGEVTNIEVTYYTKSGDVRYGLTSASIITLHGVPHILAITKDITDLKRSVEAIRDSEARYHRLFATMLDGFALHEIICNESGKPVDYRFLEINPAFERLTGWNAADLIGKTVLETMPETEDIWIERYGHVALTGEPAHFESYSQEFGRHYEVSAYCPKRGQFAVFFMDITERIQADEKIQSQITRLNDLREIDMAIIGATDIRITLKIIIDKVVNQLRVAAAAVLLYNPSSMLLEYAATAGFHDSIVNRSRLRLGEGYAGRVALDQQMIAVHKVKSHEQKLWKAQSFTVEPFTCYWGIPLIAKGKLQGVMEVFTHDHNDHHQDWLDFLEILAGQAAIAIDNAELFNGLLRSNTKLRLAYDATIEGWSRAMDLRDKETEGHSQRVTDLTLELAQLSGVGGEELIDVRRGALLHDIGKLGVPDAILQKPDKLTDGEWIIMRKHPIYAYEMLSPIAYLRNALDIPYCHHEKWNGRGYPRGLQGPQIPFSARLFAIVDVCDALLSDRPYRKAWPLKKVLDYIRSMSGSDFDPQAVALFFQAVNKR